MSQFVTLTIHGGISVAVNVIRVVTVRPHGDGSRLVVGGYHDLDVVESFDRVLELIGGET